MEKEIFINLSKEKGDKLFTSLALCAGSHMALQQAMPCPRHLCLISRMDLLPVILFHCPVSQGSGKLLCFSVIPFTLLFQLSSNVSKLNTQEAEQASIAFSTAEVSRFSSIGFHFTLQITSVPSESLWLLHSL